MKLTFKLQKEDYLTHQLYLATQTPSIKYRRETLKWMFSLIYVGIGVLFFINQFPLWQGGLFVVLGVVWFVCFSILHKKRYKKSYSKVIDESFSEVLKKEITISIDPENVITTNGETEACVKVADVDSLVELKEMLLLTLKTGMTLIIPKRAVSDVEEFVMYCSKIGITHKNKVDWQWG